MILFAREGSPQLVSLFVFGSLIAITAHLPVVLRKGVCVSPGLLVGMAAIVVFDSQHSLLGAALVGSLTQVRILDFRKDRWGWVPFNAGLSFLSYLAAATVLTVSHASSLQSTPLAVLVMAPAALAYMVVAWSLIVLSYRCEGTRSPREVLAELLPAGVDILPFAVLGFLVGRLYLDLGAGVLALIFVPILIAREVFRSYMSVTQAHDETVQMLIRALEAKDRYTAGHAERVAKYAGYIGEEIKLMTAGAWSGCASPRSCTTSASSSCRTRFSTSPGRLTEDEFARMRVHEKVAVQMLSHIDFLRPIAESRAQRPHAVRPDDPRPPDRAVHRDDRRRVRRDDVDALVPQGAPASRSRSRSCATKPASSSTRRASRRSSTPSSGAARSTAPASNATSSSRTHRNAVSARPVWETCSRPTEATATAQRSARVRTAVRGMLVRVPERRVG